MAFVQIQEEKLDYRLLQGTVLSGKNFNVVALPDHLLLQLDDLKVPYTQIEEGDLPTLLTSQGMSYYQNLKENNPDLLFRELSMPPAQHIEILFRVDEFRLQETLDLLDEFDAEIVSQRDTVAHKISSTSSQSDVPAESKLMAELKVVLPAANFPNLRAEVSNRELAAFNRHSAIQISQDPDKAV